MYVHVADKNTEAGDKGSLIQGSNQSYAPVQAGNPQLSLLTMGKVAHASRSDTLNLEGKLRGQRKPLRLEKWEPSDLHFEGQIGFIRPIHNT